MFRIGMPKLYEKDGELYYSSHIKDDVCNIDEEIWYKSSELFGNYFSYEVADSFVVACLLPAIHTDQDIYVDSSYVGEAILPHFQFCSRCV